MKIVLMAMGAGLLAGCGGGQNAPINTGLARVQGTTQPVRPPAAAPATPSTPTEKPAWASGLDVDLTELLDKPEKGRIFGTNEPQPPISEKTGPVRMPAADGSTVVVKVDPLEEAGPVRTIGTGPAPETRTLEQRIDDAVVGLIDLLTQQSLAGETPWKSLLALAAMDALHPGAIPQVISPDEKGTSPWSADDRRAVESLRAFFAGVAAIDPKTLPERRADLMAELAAKFGEMRPMRIGEAVLCSKVMGYGRYVPLPSSAFQQGRPVRTIVYTELERFGHRPATTGEAPGGETWAVDVSQTIQVYHDADGVLAWSRPEERLIEASRNKRRDFYLVHDITLPPTLTIGAYQLKVTMKDRTTGQQDEKVIPFRVVAEVGRN